MDRLAKAPSHIPHKRRKVADRILDPEVRISRRARKVAHRILHSRKITTRIRDIKRIAPPLVNAREYRIPIPPSPRVARQRMLEYVGLATQGPQRIPRIVPLVLA